MERTKRILQSARVALRRSGEAGGNEQELRELREAVSALITVSEHLLSEVQRKHSAAELHKRIEALEQAPMLHVVVDGGLLRASGDGFNVDGPTALRGVKA